MRWIVGLGIRLASLMLVVAAVAFAAGVVALSHAPVDTLPELSQPTVQVQTEALGLSASEVEQFITVPLEDEFNGLAWSEHIRSQSLPGLSTVVLTFRPGTDLYAARQLVTERVAQGPAMVNVGSPPVMIQPQSSSNRVMMVGLSSASMPMVDLSTLAYWQIRPRLLAVPGVAGVSIWGQRDKELQVLVDPARLNAKGVTLEQVLSTAGDAMWTSPLTFVEASSPGADGFIDMPNQRISVQHILPIRSAEDLAQIPIEETGANTVRLGEVSDVVKDHPPLRGDAVLASGRGFLMVVEKLPNTDTLAVTRGLESALAAMKPGLGDVHLDTTVFRPATFVESALQSLGLAGLAALLLVSAGLGLAMRSWRVALIAFTSIALSFVTAAYVLYLRSTTFTLLTATGLAMSLGVVVGASAIGIAAVRQRLAERPEDDPTPASQLVTESASRAARATGLVLAIAALAATPMLLLGGLAGKLLDPVGVAYLLALGSAAAVALLVTPLLCLMLLPAEKPVQPSAFGERMRAGLSAVVGTMASRRWLAWALLLALIGLGIGAGMFVTGGPLVPPMRDNDFVVQWAAVPGTSLAEIDRVASKVGAELRAINGVAGVSSHAGQALMGDQIVDVESAETWITLAPGADRDATLAKVRTALFHYPGLDHELLTYPESVVSAATPDSARKVTVRVYGSDTGVLRAQADVLKHTLDSMEGLANANVAAEIDQPTLQIDASVTAGARYGLSPGAIRRQSSVLMAGIPVGSYYEQQRIFDVAVWSEPAVHDSISAIKNVSLETPSGGHVALSSVADVSLVSAPHEIDHDRAERYVDVTADVTDASMARARADIERVLANTTMPLGYHAEVVDDSEQAALTLPFVLAALCAFVVIYLILQAAFSSWRRATLVVLSLPISVAGSLVVISAAGWNWDVAALAGLTMASGVALLAGVLVVGSLPAEDLAEPSASPAEQLTGAVREAAHPVALLVLTTACAMLPFAVASNFPGLEILGPMSSVVLGGLVSTVLVQLLIVPVLSVSVPRPAPAEAVAAQEEEESA